jgi:hypothetical protein
MSFCEAVTGWDGRAAAELAGVGNAAARPCTDVHVLASMLGFQTELEVSKSSETCLVAAH